MFYSLDNSLINNHIELTVNLASIAAGGPAWRSSTLPKANTLRQSPSTSEHWRSRKRPLAPSIPRWPPCLSTYQGSMKPWASVRKRNSSPDAPNRSDSPSARPSSWAANWGETRLLLFSCAVPERHRGTRRLREFATRRGLTKVRAD